MTPHFPMWIDNEPRAGETALITNPWNGAPAASVSTGSAADVESAIAAAVRAFEVTRRASSAERSGWLERMADGLQSRRDEIAAAITAEAGKPIALSRVEVDRAVVTFRTGAEEARRIGGEVLPLDGTPAGRGRIGLTRRFPAGVVAGIVPFNFPLNLAAHKVAPALAAGCTVVLKPPPQSPGPTLLLGEIARDAGIPPGALNVVLAPVAESGALVDDPRIAVLSFTGSARVGWALKARAARKKVILELGGNAALVVDQSADLDRAADRAAIAGFAFAGQVCIKAQRLFVERSVYADFRERLLAAIDRIVVGDPTRDDVLAGPVIDDASADRIAAWTAAAVAAGARIVAGGEREGRLLRPAVLEDAPPDALVSREEVFGPVMTLAPFDDFAEALRQVNRGPYGLQAGVFTRDLGRSLQAFEEIEAGAIILNDAPNFRVDPMPYGGIKESGFGREGLRYAIEEMTELRLLVLPPPG